MFSEAKIACGGPAAVAGLVEYYQTIELPREHQARAEYYERESNVVLRPDMHPTVLAGLGIDPGRPLTNAELANLLSGNRADGARIEGKHYSRERQSVDPKTGEDRTVVPLAAIDFTWTPAKSVSAAFGTATSPAERSMIHSAIVRAGRDGMAFIEQERARARLGAGGQDGYEQGHLGWMEFNHYLARQTDKRSIVDSPVLSSDPNPHVHFVTFAAVFCESGRVGSFNDGWIVPVRMQADAIAHMRVAQYLQADGFAVEMDPKTGACEMAAVPRRIREEYSRRTRQGEERAREYVAEKGIDWERMTLKQQRALVKTMIQPEKLPIPEGADAATKARIIRENKARIKLGKDDVADFDAWRERGKSLGWEPTTLMAYGPPAPELSPEARQQMAYLESLPFIEKMFETRATVAAWEMRVAASKGLTAWGGGDQSDIDAVTALMREHGVRQDGQMTALVWGREDGQEYHTVTTALHQAREMEFMRLVSEAAKDTSAALPRELLERHIRASGLDFSGEHGEAQLALIRQLGMGGRYGVGVAVAGAGKSTALKPLISAWKEQGRAVYGAALGWNQADNLTDSGIEQKDAKAFSVFLDAAKAGELKLDRKTVVAVDELGLLGTRQGLDLMRLQAQHGFAVVAMGDGKQCAPIEAGSALELSRKALGPEMVPEILTTKRQQAKREQTIVGLFRKGHAREALTMKREDGTAHLIEGGYREAVVATADLWKRRVYEDRTPTTVLTKENHDAHEISVAIRAIRRELGELGAEDLARVRATDQSGEREYDMKLAVGDRVRLFKSTGGKFEGGRGGNIGRNGSVMEVLAVRRSGLTLRNLKTKREGLVPWQSLTTKNGRTLLAYGDALTVNSAQSMTLPGAILSCPSGSQSLNGLDAYSGGTRQRMRSDIVVSEMAERREVAGLRPKNDERRIDTDDCWANVARNFQRQPEKSLVVSFMEKGIQLKRGAVASLQRRLQPVEQRRSQGQPSSSLPELRVTKQAERTAEVMRPGLRAAIEPAAETLRPAADRISQVMQPEDRVVDTMAMLVAKGHVAYDEARDSVMRSHLIRTGDIDLDTEDRLDNRLSDAIDRRLDGEAPTLPQAARALRDGARSRADFGTNPADASERASRDQQQLSGPACRTRGVRM
jgi:hypothetical protein